MKKKREIFCKVCKHTLCMICGGVVGFYQKEPIKMASAWAHKCKHNKLVYPEYNLVH